MARRATEAVSNNDVIRKLLELAPIVTPPLREAISVGGDWITKGVSFAAGTEFRGRHQGKVYLARVQDGALFLNGERHDSPSSAAYSITKYSINGWNFWECRTPGSESWRPISSFRK